MIDIDELFRATGKASPIKRLLKNNALAQCLVLLQEHYPLMMVDVKQNASATAMLLQAMGIISIFPVMILKTEEKEFAKDSAELFEKALAGALNEIFGKDHANLSHEEICEKISKIAARIAILHNVTVREAEKEKGGADH